MTIAEAILFD